MLDPFVSTHKIDTYRRYVAIPKAIIRKSEQNATLSNSSVSNNDQLFDISDDKYDS